MAYVYLYSDPRTPVPEPIYVGKGKGKRFVFHKTRAKNPILKRKIEHINNAGLEPIIEIIKDNISDEEAMQLEILLIIKYGRLHLGTGTLCNLTEGGEGTVGYKHSEETKKLFSQQRKGKKQTSAQYSANLNRTISEETRFKQSLANKGHSRHTLEQIEKITNLNKDKLISEETKKLWSQQRKGKKQTSAQYAANCNRVYKNYKKVKCLNNDIIYDSLNEASKELGFRPTTIATVARGDRKSHKGFKFEYV